jgi:hypothetical protein
MPCCCGDQGCATRDGCTLSVTWLGRTETVSGISQSYTYSFSQQLPACPSGTFPFGNAGRFEFGVFCCDIPAEIIFPWQAIRDACAAPVTGKTYIAVRLGLQDPDVALSNPSNRNCGRFWLYSLPSGSGNALASQSATLIADVLRVEYCSQISFACQPYTYPSLEAPQISLSCNPLP